MTPLPMLQHFCDHTIWMYGHGLTTFYPSVLFFQLNKKVNWLLCPCYNSVVRIPFECICHGHGLTTFYPSVLFSAKKESELTTLLLLHQCCKSYHLKRSRSHKIGILDIVVFNVNLFRNIIGKIFTARNGSCNYH